MKKKIKLNISKLAFVIWIILIIVLVAVLGLIVFYILKTKEII